MRLVQRLAASWRAFWLARQVVALLRQETRRARVGMTCYRPLRGWRSAEPNENGKYPIVFSAKGRHGDVSQFVDIPCGQCIGCRLERARQWACRCVHELKCHDHGVFVTLTFNDDALRKRGHTSVDIRDVQLFLKRVRKRYGSGIKFMASGEYGDDNGRPHYHVILFGVHFDDQKYWRTSNAGMKLYRSAKLEKIWCDPGTGVSYGYSSLGAVTFQSAAYVASYVLKKQVSPVVRNGAYSLTCADFDCQTGKISPRKSEFGCRSLGLGKEWFDRYHEEWFRDDCVVHEGREQAVPKYYEKQYALIDPVALEKLKKKRRERARVHKDNNTDRRLRVRERVRDARVEHLFVGRSIGA